MRRTSPSPAPLDGARVREVIAALKHDLGKYVAWRSVNLPADAWEGPVLATWIDSVRADVLATRSSSEGAEPAWEVFAAHARELPPPWPAELAAVAEAVDALRAAEPALRSGDAAALATHRPAIRAAQQTIRSQLAALHRRLLEA